MTETLKYEVQIRDSQDHASNDAGDDADVEVLENTLHPNVLDGYSNIRVHMENTHDTTFDVDVETAAADDADWSGVATEATVTGGNGAATVTGPVGKLRLLMLASAVTAPTSGSLIVRVYATG